MTEACLKIWVIALSCLTVLFFVVGGAGPSILQAILDNKIEDEIILEEKDHKKWGSFPGDIGIVIKRDYIFYRFTNHEDVIYRGAQPVFNETKLFGFQELLDYEDRDYIEDENVVKFSYFQRFTRYSGSDFTGDEDITFMNLGPLSSWEKLKNNKLQDIALTVLSNLFQGLDADLINQVIAQGIGQNVLNNFDQNTIKLTLQSFNIPGIKEVQLDAISTDFAMGWTQNGLKVWMDSIFDASQGSVQPKKQVNNLQLQLQDYFGLNEEQRNSILDNLYNMAAQTYQVAFQNGFCQHPLLSQTGCSNKNISAAQWTSALLTAPRSLAPQGYLELSLYYQNVFSNMDESNLYRVSNDPVFNVQFSLQWAEQVMKYLQDPDFIKEPQALLNIGNLGLLYQWGEMFDTEMQQQQHNYQNSTSLGNIMERFQLESREHSFVFWNYMKYLAIELGKQTSLGGNTESSSAGSLSQIGIENSFKGLQQFLLPTLTSMMMQGAFQLTQTTCNMIIEDIGILDENNQEAICNTLNSNGQVMDLQSIQIINAACMQSSVEAVNALQFLNQGLVDALCNPPSLYGQELLQTNSRLKTHYNCQDFSGKCTNYEIAVKQWVSGEITLNPIDEIAPVVQPADSVYNWFPQIFSAPIEYYAISKRFEDIFQDKELFFPDMQQLRQWLSSQKLYNPQLVGITYIWNQNNLQNVIQQQLFTTNSEQLVQYFRYIALEGTLNGFLITRKLEQALFEYEDPFLKNIRERNPQNGGNPSILPTGRLSAKNQTREESRNETMEFYTGKDDIKKLKEIRSAQGVSEFITRRVDVFDGFNVKTVNLNPWEDEIEYKGNDGTSAGVDQQVGQDTTAHVFPLYFGAKIPQIRETSRSGLKCYRYEIVKETLQNETTNPDNKGQFFNGPSGQLNLTKALQSPIFISGPHFINADSDLLDNITVYNENGDMQGPTEWDKTFLEAEEHSGVSIQVSLKQQINYQMKPDLLFPLNFTRYLPVYYLERGYNFTNEQINEEFDTLKDLLNAKNYLYAFGFSLAGVCLIALVFSIFKYKKAKKMQLSKNYTKQSYLDPTQPSEHIPNMSQQFQKQVSQHQQQQEPVQPTEHIAPAFQQ